MGNTRTSFLAYLTQPASEWLLIGSAGYPKRQTQRIILTNMMVSVTATLSYAHAIGFAIYDFKNLYVPIAILLLIGTALLATPYLNKKNPYLGSIYNLSLWLIYGCSLLNMFGSESGLQFYFLAGASSAILIMGTYQNLLSVASITLQMGLFIYFDHWDTPPASFLITSPQFISWLYFSTVILSMGFVLCMVFYAFHQAQKAEDALENEYVYSETLLANILPTPIASQLKRHPGKIIANSHDNVTILFADIVGFTPRAHSQEPTELLTFLNALFTRFDHLADKHELEKIKTLGDAFMVAGGMPNSQPDHAHRVAQMALDMMNEIKDFALQLGENIDLRIGIHTGPAVAGVIGTQKPVYDVWGDTVNIAARMEAQGTNGHIQVTEDTKNLLVDSFNFNERGELSVKGKGNMHVWYLTGAKK